jgi:monofunctional biosynthetic peptidoglycan transglycosylase
VAKLRGKLRWIVRAGFTAGAAGFALLAYVYLTLPDVRPLATVNPTSTAFMELRAEEAAAAGRPVRRVQRWVPYSRISQSLKRAVLVAEDDAFWQHEGIDIEQIRASMEINIERGRAVRGASTITQQLAKNLYLSPSRDPLRKLRELIIARRLEAALPKARIFELYLNVIEWGDGIWGAEAASRAYFGLPASALGPEQAALLAGAIVNPRVLNPAHPNGRLLGRQRIILARMGSVTPPTLAPVISAAPPETTEEESVPEGAETLEAQPIPEAVPHDTEETPQPQRSDDQAPQTAPQQ